LQRRLLESGISLFCDWCRDAANRFYEAIRILAGVTVDVNETDDGYLFGQIRDLPDDKADAIETIVGFTTFVEVATI
jgi:hypothetical protein